MKSSNLHGLLPWWTWRIMPLVFVLIISSCGDDEEEEVIITPKIGTAKIVVATSGVETDQDGYTVILSNGLTRHAGPNETVIFEDLPAGNYFVRLEGIRVTCDLTEENERMIWVQDGMTFTENYNFTCTAKPIIFSYELYDVYRMNLDGTGIVQLHEGGEPVWSPDGEKIALTIDKEYVEFEGESGLYLIDENGAESTLVVENARGASWSPDGAYLVTVLDNQLYTVKADGSELTQLTSLEGYIQDPDWSSAGILFGYQPANEEGGIFKIQADGTGLEQLTTGEDSQPSYSSDGTRIAFTRRNIDVSSIYVLGPDGDEPVLRTESGNTEYAPRWSPDDMKLTFVSRFITECYYYGNVTCTMNQVTIGSSDGQEEEKIGWTLVGYLRPDWRTQ